MASRSKNKTTFAKLAREGRLRERRMEKQAKKEARKRAVESPPGSPGDTHVGEEADADLASPADHAGSGNEDLPRASSGETG